MRMSCHLWHNSVPPLPRPAERTDEDIQLIYDELLHVKAFGHLSNAVSATFSGCQLLKSHWPNYCLCGLVDQGWASHYCPVWEPSSCWEILWACLSFFCFVCFFCSSFSHSHCPACWSIFFCLLLYFPATFFSLLILSLFPSTTCSFLLPSSLSFFYLISDVSYHSLFLPLQFSFCTCNTVFPPTATFPICHSLFPQPLSVSLPLPSATLFPSTTTLSSTLLSFKALLSIFALQCLRSSYLLHLCHLLSSLLVDSFTSRTMVSSPDTVVCCFPFASYSHATHNLLSSPYQHRIVFLLLSFHSV